MLKIVRPVSFVLLSAAFCSGAKNKTEIHVTTIFDGELDATDVFVSLIAQKHSRKTDKEYLAKSQEI